MAIPFVGREWAYRLKDFVQHSAAVSALTGWYHAGRGAVTRSRPERLRRFAAAYAKTESPALAGRITALCNDPVAGDLARHHRHATVVANPRLDRGVILKRPGANGERGVIHLTPEYNWLRFLHAVGPDADELAERYTVWLTVSWSPPDYHLLGLVAARLPGPLFVSPGNRRDVPALERFHPRVRCLPAIASDWILPDLIRPKPRTDRRIDVLMVANWAAFKRHWHLFAALRGLPPSARVTLVGQSDGRFNLDGVRRQMRELGVRQDVEFLQDLRVEEVYERQCDSRVSVIFSRREGACVVVTESLFADTPVGMLRGARIGSLDYINARTGVLFDRQNTGRQLAAFLDSADSYRPREWAVEHIGCDRSLAKVNAALRDHALADGRPWTNDLVPFCWKPDPTYLRGEDRRAMLPAYHELEVRYPAAFGPRFVPTALSASATTQSAVS